MKPGLLYFHGFNTAPEPPSEKILTLRALVLELGLGFYAPALRYHQIVPEQPLSLMDGSTRTAFQSWLANCSQVIVAGSSLGGWLARRWPAQAVAGRLLINPVTGALQQLSGQDGAHWVNYVTGEQYCLPRDFRARLEAVQQAWPARVTEPTLVLLDLADEVLDSEATRQRLQPHAEILAYPGGSHRFEHLSSAAPRLRAWFKQLVFR
jgi:hypothetical protein